MRTDDCLKDKHTGEFYSHKCWHKILGIPAEKEKIMIQRKATTNKRTQVNFNASPEIIYWAKKYNASQEEIQQLFAETGYSISKTIAVLQQKKQAA
jgi:hypothetical protein